jgi:hypothetical protein
MSIPGAACHPCEAENFTLQNHSTLTVFEPLKEKRLTGRLFCNVGKEQSRGIQTFTPRVRENNQKAMIEET